MMTGYSLLDNLVSALTGNSALCTLVNSKIYKNKAISASVIDLSGDVNKSQISCELSDLHGQILSADQVFVVDIRTRKEIAGDRGAEYCAQIADAVRAILDDGFVGATVTKIYGVVAFDGTIKGYRCKLQVSCHVKSSFTLTVTPSQASPQAATSEIVFTAIASPSLGLEYRFLLNGPGSGGVTRDMSGWQSRNSFTWRTTSADVGTSTLDVEIRGGINKGAADQSTSVSYTISATSVGTGTAPEITSLTPSLASPQEEQTRIDFICVATDADSNPIFYRFFITGPGTASKKMLVQDWGHRNSWQWQPLVVDIGDSTIEVQIRDGNHAGEGSYDDNVTASYTITAAAGTGPGTEPTITSLTPSLASPQEEQTKIDFICIASDTEVDPIQYRFYLTGPGTASKKKLVQDWSHKNAWPWQPQTVDVGTSTIEVQIRDGLHATEGSYDDNATASYTVTAAAGIGTAPEVTSLTPSLASPQEEQTKIDFICVATDVDSNPIFYRFFLTGPGTAGVKMLVQDWGHKNAWPWQPQTVDVGESTIEVQIRDGLHAAEGSYDDNATVVYTTTAAYGIGNAPTITSLAPRLASPQPPGTEIEIIATAAGSNGVELLYKFWHKPPGAEWKDLSPWGTQNWIRWIPTLADSGTNSIRVDVIDGQHAERGSHDATSTISYTISP